jgi:allantoinase
VVVEREQLLDRHRLSPYVGRRLRGRIVRTILRGETVALDGRIVGAPRGRILAEPLFSPAQRD